MKTAVNHSSEKNSFILSNLEDLRHWVLQIAFALWHLQLQLKSDQLLNLSEPGPYSCTSR